MATSLCYPINLVKFANLKLYIMHNTVFYIILGIVIVSFLFDRLLSYLNIKNMTTQLPSEVADVFKADEYEKQQKYQKANSKFGMISPLA